MNISSPTQNQSLTLLPEQLIGLVGHLDSIMENSGKGGGGVKL